MHGYKWPINCTRTRIEARLAYEAWARSCHTAATAIQAACARGAAGRRRARERRRALGVAAVLASLVATIVATEDVWADVERRRLAFQVCCSSYVFTPPSIIRVRADIIGHARINM